MTSLLFISKLGGYIGQVSFVFGFLLHCIYYFQYLLDHIAICDYISSILLQKALVINKY